MVLNGCSYAQIMREQLPRRSTIKRWQAWLDDKHLIHSHLLKEHFPLLDNQSVGTFWLTCFKEMSLAEAMFYVHPGQEVIP